MDSSTPKFVQSLTNVVQSLKATQGSISWVSINNPAAATSFVQLFDAALPGNVTLGTTAPTLSLPIAAGGTLSFVTDRTGFFNGIQAAATTTATGAAAPTAAVIFNAGLR